MRETWARRLAMASASLLLLIAATLAGWRNRDRPPPAPLSWAQSQTPAATKESPQRSAVLRQRGAEVYRSQACAACHALAGQGNASHPLDGIGTRLAAPEIRQWITADPDVASQLSVRVRKRKAVYAALPEEDLAALVAFLAQTSDDRE